MQNIEKPKKVIVIGGGISGLSAGIYAQRNGFISEIYEKNPMCGGLCTAWIRKNFPIDGCIHWMTGTKNGTAMYKMWQDLGGFSDEEIIQQTDFGTIEIDGHKIVLWCDLDKFEKELIEISPKDKRRIKKTVDLIFLFQNMPLPVDVPTSLMSLWRLLGFGFSMIPYLINYLKCSKISAPDYGKKFKSPILRKLFEKLVPGDNNLYSTLYVYGTVALGNGGIPVGGSKALINNLVQSYNNHGGNIQYNSEVDRLIVDGKKVKGIQLKNGKRVFADYVVCACDPFHVEQLLENKFEIKEFDKRAAKPSVFVTQSAVLISYEVDLEAKQKLGITSTYEFYCKSFKCGHTLQNSIRIREYSYDEYFMKNGKTLFNVLIPQDGEDYDFWAKFNTRESYLAEKNKIAEIVTNEIYKHFPSLVGHLNLLDVATPKTIQRYTNAYKGAYMPFAFTENASMLIHNGRVKGLDNLMLASQWMIMPGGIPVAMMCGKFAIQRILKLEKRNFDITKRIKFVYER